MATGLALPSQIKGGKSEAPTLIQAQTFGEKTMQTPIEKKLVFSAAELRKLADAARRLKALGELDHDNLAPPEVLREDFGIEIPAEVLRAAIHAEMDRLTALLADAGVALDPTK